FALHQAMVGRKLQEPRAARAPRWVFRVLQRALSPLPEERWGSMDALLGELSKDAAGSRKRAALASLGALAVVAAAAAPLWLSRAQERQCERSADRIAQVWGPAQRDALSAQFAKWPHGPDSFSRTARALDAYAGEWSALQRESCLATHARHELSAE